MHQVTITTGFTRKTSYASGLANCASLVQTLESAHPAEDAAYDVADLQALRRKQSEDELLANLAATPLGQSLLLLASNMRQPLGTAFSWLQVQIGDRLATPTHRHQQTVTNTPHPHRTRTGIGDTWLAGKLPTMPFSKTRFTR
eukprot:8634286-Pyramimonas_sp.AAC.2